MSLIKDPEIYEQLDPVMRCGSPHMLAAVQAVLAERIFAEGNHSGPGHLVIEKAFVER